ncbi:hypothetical protein [Nonomuraea diastatica]|uniref:Uncharacterized protein n=1 Tax=Nonomuraea diastatica TaxID=1848329 RepID=A0A4R4WE04_9ACTN|nr:hypothetical protein [Nonomuraea diastatica]TDD17238.1 hypothetical protein E1294_28375 [Nonomuraea diastatica]
MHGVSLLRAAGARPEHALDAVAVAVAAVMQPVTGHDFYYLLPGIANDVQTEAHGWLRLHHDIDPYVQPIDYAALSDEQVAGMLDHVAKFARVYGWYADRIVGGTANETWRPAGNVLSRTHRHMGPAHLPAKNPHHQEGERDQFSQDSSPRGPHRNPSDRSQRETHVFDDYGTDQEAIETQWRDADL